MALAFLRRYQRDVLLKALLAVVIVGFVLIYIPPLLQGNAAGLADEVGRVGDQSISAIEYQRAYTRLRSQYERMYKGKVDAATLRMMGLPDQVFDSLVDQRIVALEGTRRGIKVTDQDLVRTVSSMPELQENGRFVGVDRIKRMLEAQGQTVDDFEQSLRNDLMRRRLEGLVTDGIEVSDGDVEREYRHRNEQLKAEYVLVDSARFRKEVSVGDDEVKTYFDAHKETYKLPEKRTVDYVLVGNETVRSQITVTDNEVQGHYRAHSDEFKETEEVCARHILVRTKSDSNPTGRTPEDAKKVAGELLAKVKGGADFAAVAKESSEDTGSASRGGDLGCFPRSTMVAEFENAAFTLAPGTISDLVKTQYGYHIIKVEKHKDEETKPFEAVRDRIKNELTTNKAQALVESKAATIAEALAKGKKLDEAARVAGIEVKRSAPLARDEQAPPFDGAALSRIFELKAGEVDPQPITSGRGNTLFVALRETTPPRVPDLSEVKEKVKSDLLDKKALDMAKEKAAEVKAKAAGQSLEAASAGLGLTRKETQALVHHDQPIGDLPSGVALDEAAFALAPQTLSDPIPVTGGYAIVRVLEKKSVDPAAFEKEKPTVAESLRDQRKSQLFQAYLKHARERFVVEKRSDVVRRIVG